MKRYGVALMFLRAYGRSPCPYVLKHIWSYVLMFFCSYGSALADKACEGKSGVSLFGICDICR